MCGSSGRARFSSISLLFSAALWCAGAHAQTLVHFDLPEQPLARSLMAIGTATNTDVGFSASEVAGFFAPPLKAELTVDGALQRVLAGTGLRPKHLDDHTIVIAAAEASTSNSGRLKLWPARVSSPAKPGGQIVVAQAETIPNSNDNPSSSSASMVDLEEIVVTGSHIHGVGNRTSPIIVIDRDELDRSGYSTTTDLFRSLPQNFQNAGASEDGFLSATQASGNNVERGTGVDLRGLGPSSTLVLLNGHRLAPSAFGSFVDVSQIPLAAVDRVEILTDGSSAIYGSDAVGGVVNIILRKDYQGADTAVRYGAATRGGRDEVLASQTAGSDWSGGNAVGTLQFQRQGALPAADRAFASAVSQPNDLLPESRNYAATFDGRQALFDGLEFHGDILLSKRQFASFNSTPELPLGYNTQLNSGDANSINMSPGLLYNFSSKWTAELNGLYGYQKTSSNIAESVPGFAFTDTRIGIDNRFIERSIDLVFDGRLWSSRAGDIAVAFGGSYRTENLSSVLMDTFGSAPMIGRRSDDQRHVTAEFAELHVPIVGAANHLPLVQALDLSVALRRDKYSDFGSTTNPHFGLRWAPLPDITLRASYGKSFRAPNASEELTANSPPIIYNYEVLSPAGPGFTPALVLGGGKTLAPERARTLNFGLEFKPLDFPSFSGALDYYDIRYNDRIIIPPIPINFLQQPGIYGSLISPIANDAAAQAIVDAAVAAGATFIDSYGTGVTGVRYLYDDRQQNASVVRQSGFDLTSRFIKTFDGYTWTSQANVAFTDRIDTQFVQGAATANPVNTFGSPVKWRARFGSSWGGAAYSFSGALNFVGSYINTNAVSNPPISAWTTLDLNATLNADALFRSYGWRGISFSVIVLNLLDRDPPHVSNSNAEFPVSYDPANSTPLGRFIAVALRKKW